MGTPAARSGPLGTDGSLTTVPHSPLLRRSYETE
jgi:hypothetical protein